MAKRRTPAPKKKSSAFSRVFTILCAIGATGGLFVLLPVINKIAETEKEEEAPPPVENSIVDEPDEVVEEEDVEEEEEPEEEEPPPELEENVEPLDLAALESALAADFGAGDAMGADLGFDLSSLLQASGQSEDEIFGADDLDSGAVATSQPATKLSNGEQKATPCKAVVIFIVDERGRVVDPKVTRIGDDRLKAAALRTVKGWKFSPGTRDGKNVSSRMRVQISFPKQ